MAEDSPIIIVNLKTYSEGYGWDGFKLCKVIEEVAKETNSNLAVAVSAIDLVDYSDNLDIPVFAQHVDGINFGSHTGSILPEAVKYSGAVGTLVNHAECQMTWAEIEKAINRCKELELLTVLCTADLESTKKGAHLNPNMIAVEPPELIGGEVSVSSARPEIISDSVKIVEKINPRISVLCGAGVKNQKDISKAISLGSEGILLASGVVKSQKPRKVLLDLVQGL